MTAITEPRRARSTFEWHVRGLLLDFSGMSIAFSASAIAGALVFGLFMVGVRWAAYGTVKLVAALGHHPGPLPATMPDGPATMFAVVAIVLAMAVMWHVFKIAARAADRALARFALLPPPFTGQR